MTKHVHIVSTEGSMTDIVTRAQREHAEDIAIAKAHALWPKAVEYLRGTLDGAETIAKIRAAIAAQPDGTWIAPYHFGWGMAIRNALRDAGFGESPFGVKNLDNIYVELIEEAVR